MNRRISIFLIFTACFLATKAASNSQDYPLAPANILLTPSNDLRSATLTWDPVGDVGENGGHIDTQKIIYYIFDAFGSYYDPAVATTTEPSFTFDYSDLNGQDFVAYQVTAGVDDMYSLAGTSNISVVGTPAPLPFCESFAGGKFDGVWIADYSQAKQTYKLMTDATFASLNTLDYPQSVTSQDGDNGFYMWSPESKDAYYGLISLRGQIADTENPVVEFWYQGKGNKIELLTGTDCNNLVLSRTIDLEAEPTNGWTMARVNLDSYKPAGSALFEIRFKASGYNRTNPHPVLIDNLSIRNVADSGVGYIEFENTAPSETQIYTLSGMKVSTNHPAPGLYIIVKDGKAEKRFLR